MKHLVVGILFFTTGQMIHSGTLSVENKTPYKAWIGVHYNPRPSDNRIIKSGKVAYFDTQNTIVDSIEGVLSPSPGNQSKNMKINEWRNSPGRGNPQWAHIIGDGKRGYKIITNTDR
jgi:hypothetical protein